MLDHISSLSSPSSMETTSCHLRLLTQELAQSCSTGEEHFILPCHVDYATHKYSQVLCKQKISTIRVLRWQCAPQGRIPEHRNLPQLQESVRTVRTVKLFFQGSTSALSHCSNAMKFNSMLELTSTKKNKTIKKDYWRPTDKHWQVYCAKINLHSWPMKDTKTTLRKKLID